MLDQTTIKLGVSGHETEYVIQQLPSTRGMEVGIHLIKIITGAAEGVGSIREGEDFLNAEYNPAQMAAGLMKRIHEQGTPAFIKTLLKESLIIPDPVGDKYDEWYESHFSANYDELFDLIAAIISHNGYIDLIKKKTGDIIGLMLLSLLIMIKIAIS